MAALRPGRMGAASDAGKPADFTNSLADAMDTAYHDLLALEGMSTFALNTNSREARDRRRMFVAIAQGIVRHLRDNGAALRVVNALNVPTGEKIRVDVDGTLL